MRMWVRIQRDRLNLGQWQIHASADGAQQGGGRFDGVLLAQPADPARALLDASALAYRCWPPWPVAVGPVLDADAWPFRRPCARA